MLRAHKHLTKKEIKKDPFLIFVAEAVDFMEREWMKIGGILLGTFVVIVAAVLIVNGTRKSDLNAYDSAMTAFYTSAPESIDLMTRYVDKHSGSPNATKVALQLANYYFIQKNYETAEKYYRQSIGKVSGDAIFGFNAYNGLGAILEERGDFDQAAKNYESFVQAFGESAFTEAMRFKAGKAYFLAGNKESAERNFQTILDSAIDSELKQEARYYIELISS